MTREKSDERRARGLPERRLSDSAERAIRASNERGTVLARRYGVSPALISRIRGGYRDGKLLDAAASVGVVVGACEGEGGKLDRGGRTMTRARVSATDVASVFPPPAPREAKPPRFGILAHEATEWLRANRGEELTQSDMAIKFGRRVMQADVDRLRSACELRLLDRRREHYERGQPWVYTAGAKL